MIQIYEKYRNIDMSLGRDLLSTRCTNLTQKFSDTARLAINKGRTSLLLLLYIDQDLSRTQFLNGLNLAYIAFDKSCGSTERLVQLPAFIFYIVFLVLRRLRTCLMFAILLLPCNESLVQTRWISFLQSDVRVCIFRLN